MPPDSILTCLHCSPQNFFLACIVTLLMLMMLLLLLLLLLGRAASIGRSLRLPMFRGLGLYVSVCWSQPRALQKPLNRDSVWGCGLWGTSKPCSRWGGGVRVPQQEVALYGRHVPDAHGQWTLPSAPTGCNHWGRTGNET